MWIQTRKQVVLYYVTARHVASTRSVDLAKGVPQSCAGQGVTPVMSWMGVHCTPVQSWPGSIPLLSWMGLGTLPRTGVPSGTWVPHPGQNWGAPQPGLGYPFGQLWGTLLKEPGTRDLEKNLRLGHPWAWMDRHLRKPPDAGGNNGKKIKAENLNFVAMLHV